VSASPSPVHVGPNEVLRFALEIAALVALGYAGLNLVDDALVGAVLGVALPLTGAVLWGVFRVDGDPKVAPVPVPGVVRLCLEFDFFAAAVLLLGAVGALVPAAVLGGLVVLHYAWGWRRIVWLRHHPGRLASMREPSTGGTSEG